MTKKIDSKYLLALNAHQHIGSQTIKKILMVVPDPSLLWERGAQILNGKIDQKIVDYVKEVLTNIDPDKEIEKLTRYGVGYLTIFDSAYPSLLKEVYDAPVVLYVRGKLATNGDLNLGVVGSRKYTDYGKMAAYKLSKECAHSGLTIVSGLALGIDAEAHRAALDAGGVTIGVLGCGLDTVYPVSNYQLAKEMIEKGGAIISEFSIGTPPLRYNFPARNRIIAGLSKGLLVVEAAEKSGALITAYQSLEYNRDVFAVPGEINSPNSFGTNKLIQSGAKLTMTSEDILNEYNIEKTEFETEAKEMLPESDNEKKILETLSKSAINIDQIIEKSGLNVIAISSALSLLEMKGLVKNMGGGRYKKISNS